MTAWSAMPLIYVSCILSGDNSARSLPQVSLKVTCPRDNEGRAACSRPLSPCLPEAPVRGRAAPCPTLAAMQVVIRYQRVPPRTGFEQGDTVLLGVLDMRHGLGPFTGGAGQRPVGAVRIQAPAVSGTFYLVYVGG